MLRFLLRPLTPKRRLILFIVSLHAIVLFVCGSLHYWNYAQAMSRPMLNYILVITAFVGLVGVGITLLIFGKYENSCGSCRELSATKAHLEDEVARRTESLTRHRDALVFGLAELAHSRDDDTGAHLVRIRRYVEILAERLGFSGEEAVRMGRQSSLHDIGKVGIPDSVLLKPGRLTDDEREIIQRHALIGGNCLLAVRERLGEADDFLEGACQIALAHHEWWNGAGYPHGLAGEAIPMIARIAAVADVYDALTSDRPYKKAFDHEKSRAIMLDSDGTQFDPVVVQAFLQCEERFQEIARNYGDAVSDDGCSALREMATAVIA